LDETINVEQHGQRVITESTKIIKHKYTEVFKKAFTSRISEQYAFSGEISSGLKNL
jgi:hypothetical protein